MSKGCDVIVSEGGDAMSRDHRLRVLVRLLGVLQGLPGMFLSSLVFLLSLRLGDPVSMRGGVVQFRGSLMVLIVRSVVIASRHIYRVPFTVSRFTVL